MYFNDRIALGKMLANRLDDCMGRDAIIICLKEESLLTCLSLAMELKAWIFPLIYELIYNHAEGKQVIGAIDQSGAFIASNKLGSKADEDDDRKIVTDKLINQQQDLALASIRKRQAAYNMKFDTKLLHGRDVILVADVLTDALPLMVAEHILPRTKLRSLSIAIGNASPEVADIAQLSAEKVVLIDIISGIMLNSQSYFKEPDSYNEDQKRKLTKHIATYW